MKEGVWHTKKTKGDAYIYSNCSRSTSKQYESRATYGKDDVLSINIFIDSDMPVKCDEAQGVLGKAIREHFNAYRANDKYLIVVNPCAFRKTFKTNVQFFLLCKEKPSNEAMEEVPDLIKQNLVLFNSQEEYEEERYLEYRQNFYNSRCRIVDDAYCD